MIRRGLLSDYFEGVAVKRLSMVETTPDGSNQHEFNSSRTLRALMGDADRKKIPTRFIWLGDEQEGIAADGMLSWYDARRKHATRTEYHLYYYTNDVTDLMKEGDTLFVALLRDGSAMTIVTPADSTVQNQLLWLFGLEDQPELQFTGREITEDQAATVDFAARYILDELGIDFEEPEAGELDMLIEKFGMKFPGTREFSQLARTSLAGVSALDNPDAVLMAWLEREELLFRRLERHIVAERLRNGFVGDDEVADVDGFLAFSLSVQNRRKSRAGQSLEHHLEALFQARSIRFSRGAETENRNRPDFLFPGHAEYSDLGFSPDLLTMLASKSTLKDRWRQVLPEAARIPSKHLLTLEPAISENQTDQMKAERLQLVLPGKLHETYRDSQRSWLMTLMDFVQLVSSRQPR
ncbi:MULTISPECIES: type II restriction endonuclease [unclassified Mesorhizobium]|uniref:type II restriction endonuclease n=1 Tax=unclassified Mesorhizobium TaxID=325217 RepID=UPI001AED2180|nr:MULTISPECIES: type II restriction endonuclease [unclassified Mesorhizobium]MCA0028758.1 type II restriction endonuclease [Mesorhizobium sp. B263B1A]